MPQWRDNLTTLPIRKLLKVRIRYAKAEPFTNSTGAPLPTNANILLRAILRGRGGDEFIYLAQTNLLW